MYQKEIIYMGLYKDGNRIGNAGFLKVESKNTESRLDLKLRNIPHSIKGRFPIRIHNGAEWKEVNGIAVQEGGGSWAEKMMDSVEQVQIQITFPGGYFLEGKSKGAAETVPWEGAKEKKEPSVDKEKTWTGKTPQRITAKAQDNRPQEIMEKAQDNKTQNTVIITEEIRRPDADRGVGIAAPLSEAPAGYSLKEDKWEQILDSYEQIHPYGDERVYVKLEPKDFIILQSKYQHLVNNSFLLHGFYNYRYVILGKEQDFYLGVPGVFYEREKMVALMFGFEAFECPGGTARAGEFGYYLRKVEL